MILQFYLTLSEHTKNILFFFAGFSDFLLLKFVRMLHNSFQNKVITQSWHQNGIKTKSSLGAEYKKLFLRMNKSFYDEEILMFLMTFLSIKFFQFIRIQTFEYKRYTKSECRYWLKEPGQDQILN